MTVQMGEIRRASGRQIVDDEDFVPFGEQSVHEV
jgi:hypothetical protein